MRRCTYCGKEHDDLATACAVDHEPVEQVVERPKPGNSSFEFLRLIFKSPIREEFAVECAEFLARIIGDRIAPLRPDTKWSEIIEWLGHGVMGVSLLDVALAKKFGVVATEFLANSEFMTFRDFVEYACERRRNNAGPATTANAGRASGHE